VIGNMQPNDPNPPSNDRNQNGRNNQSMSISIDEPSAEAAMFDATVEFQAISVPDGNQMSAAVQVITSQPIAGRNSLPSSNTSASPSPRPSFGSTSPNISQPTPHVDHSAFDWSAYENRAQMLQQLKAQRKFVDVQLIAEDGQSELVHSVVMSALGDRLSSCILPQRDDPKTPCIQIPALGDHQLVAHVKQVRLTGVSGQVLRTLVECAYSGHIQSNVALPVSSVVEGLHQSNSQQQLIWAILQTAEQFAIHELVAACCTHLIYQLDINNCVRLLQLGLRCGHRLRTAAWNYIRMHFDLILAECSDFGLLTFEQVDSLLDDDSLNVQSGEQIVWEAVRRWVSVNPSQRAVHLRALLARVRFGRLPSDYISDHMLNDPLLAQLAAEAEVSTKDAQESPLETTSTMKVARKEIKDDGKLLDKSCNNSYMQQCVQLLQQMACVRRNECSQYRVDGRGLLVGLSPQLVRPRVPTEVLFAIGGWLEGVPTTSIETYDVRTDQWFEYSMYHQQPRAYHGIEVLEGLCYLIGGTNGTEILSSVHCFDPVSGRWYERANMYEQRCYVSTAQLDGLIYAMGGHNGLQRVRSVERYDHKANQWMQMPQMHLARSDASATVYESRIYIAGGLNDQVMENSVEMYDPSDDTWTFIQPMSSARTSFSLSAYGGSLYALGGNNGFERLASVERYDFATKLWTPVESMASRRSTFTACVLEDKLYVIGGYNGHTPINLVEAYDRRTARWTPVRSIKYDRSGLAVCVLNGLVNASEYTYIGMTAKKLLKTNVSVAGSTGEPANEAGTSQISVSSKDISMPPQSLNTLRPIRHRFGSRHRRRGLVRVNPDNSRRSNSVSQVIANSLPRATGSTAIRPATPSVSAISVTEPTQPQQPSSVSGTVVTTGTAASSTDDSPRSTDLNTTSNPSPTANQSNRLRDGSTVIENEIHSDSDLDESNV
jgi:kelch-like protein 10